MGPEDVVFWGKQFFFQYKAVYSVIGHFLPHLPIFYLKSVYNILAWLYHFTTNL